MKPRDEWTVGDIISNRQTPDFFFLIVTMVYEDDYLHLKVIEFRNPDLGFTQLKPSAFLTQDHCVGTLTPDQMTLLHLQAYEALHAQLLTTLFP